MMFATIAESLKPGGILGIVQHRGSAELTLEQMKKTAYVSEEKVIELAELSGLELDARSEINRSEEHTSELQSR